MQRKNSILRNHKTSKNAIAMIMAIGVIVILGTIMALALSLSSQDTKKVNDLYLYEQSVLLSKSATEYALLQIAQNDYATDPCGYQGSNFQQDTFYTINISVHYIYEAGVACLPAEFTVISTPEQSGSAIMDVTVSVNNPSFSTEPIRYFRRSIQKL